MLVGTFLMRKPLNFQTLTKLFLALMVRKPLQFQKLKGSLTNEAPTVVIKHMYNIQWAESILHELSCTPLYPHFNGGCALTCHLIRFDPSAGTWSPVPAHTSLIHHINVENNMRNIFASSSVPCGPSRASRAIRSRLCSSIALQSAMRRPAAGRAYIIGIFRGPLYLGPPHYKLICV